MGRIIKITFFISLFTIITLHSKPIQKVTLQLQWLDQFQFAGYYIAKEKGFYNESNLDVEILKYTNDINILDNVISQKATFATGRTSLLVHRNNGFPIIALAAIFQHSPAALLVTDKNILTPGDLINKKVMITPDAITSASYMSMFFSEGILKENLLIQKHSFDINDLIKGKTDAIASYISNEPYELEQKGIEYKFFHPKDYGFDFYGDILYTSQKELETNPKRVEEFTKASLKGWEYAFKNIEETAKIIYEKYNSQNKTIDQLIYEGKVLKTLAYNEKKKLGQIERNRFEEIAKTYRLLGILKKDYTLDGFIHEMHGSNNKQTLTKKELLWLKNNPKLKLATNKEWNPIEFIDDNIYSGIASGYMKLLEERLNIKFKIKKGFWDSMIQSIKQKDIDLFLAIVKTPNRTKYMNFTSSYLSFPTIIVTRDDIGYIRDFNQLSHKTVAVEKGFYTHELIASSNKSIELIEVKTTKEALEKVYKGEVFAYIGALPTTGHYIKESKYTNLIINGEAEFKTKLHFATRKDLPILHSILQKTLETITQEEHDQIYNKWLKIVYKKEPDYKIVASIIFVILLALFSLYIRNRTLKQISETDTLTKIANRRKIDKFLDVEIERTCRNFLDLSVIIMDIDYFKKVNDTYGHKTGDKVLKIVADILELNIRKYDLAGRWGGEEFIIICPNTNLYQAYRLCEKLQKIIVNTKIKEIADNNITMSFGISEYEINDTVDDLIYEADQELYKAKENGRNSIYPKI